VDEPKPAPVMDTSPPPGLDRYARRVWRRLAPILSRLGLLTEADHETFCLLCESWGRWERARRRLKIVLRADAEEATAKRLALIRSAERSVEHAEESFHRLGTLFGLSPASRSRLSVALPASDEEEVAKRFFGY
jgi:P27 family predicted phage terminase small subunit